MTPDSDPDRDHMLADIRSSLEIASDIPFVVGDGEEPLSGRLAAELFDTFEGMCERFEDELHNVSSDLEILDGRDAAVKWAGEVLTVGGYDTLVVAEEGPCLEIARAIQAGRPDLEVIVAAELDREERPQRLAKPTAALVEVDYAAADIGSLVVLRDRTASMLPLFLPECVMAILRPEQLLANQFELIKAIPPDSARNMVLITGPSRTADVEKTLILGAHGPRKVSVGILAGEAESK